MMEVTGFATFISLLMTVVTIYQSSINNKLLSDLLKRQSQN
ncbi:MAG: hypothetical protein AAFO75_03460 [Pseudomonadota bacterium]